MNRFVIGGVLAALVVLLMGGLNRLIGDRQPRSVALDGTAATADSGDLGSLPVEQAGQLVRRQGDLANGGTGTISDGAFSAPNNVPNNGMDPTGRSFITPNSNAPAAAPGTTPNVIPRTGQAQTFPTTGGDIAPIQPGLVQPGVSPQSPTDPDLEAIPALW